MLCFGLTNAPGTFQNIVNDVFKDVIGKVALVYLDDLVVFSKTKAEHYKHIKIVLQLPRDHQLYANQKKCTFVQPELQFLGHVIGSQGLQVDPKKISIVQSWPIPQIETGCRNSGAWQTIS